MRAASATASSRCACAPAASEAACCTSASRQVAAYGAKTNPADGNVGNNTPWGYGSPVAGPQTLYTKEASDSGTFPGITVYFDEVDGPWKRAR